MACTASKTPFLRSVAVRGYAASAQAQPKHSAKSTEVQTTVLPNKLIVASCETSSPISRVSILFRAGSRNETYENAGSTHLLRTTAGLTNKNSTGFAVTRGMQEVGGNLSVTTDRETIAYTVEITRNHLETGLKYLQDVATAQIFKPWELDDNMHRLKADLGRVPEQARAIDMLHQASYRTGLGNSLFCPKYQIGKISSETLQHYFASNFTTNRAAVVGVGIDHQVLAGFAQSFGIESGAGADVAAEFQGYGQLRSDKPGSMAHVAIGGQGAAITNQKEALAFAVLQYAAGVAPSLKRGEAQGALAKVVGKAVNGKPHAVSALNASYTDNGIFGFFVSASASDIGKAVEAGVRALKNGTVSSEDVARGKSQLKAAVLGDLDTGAGFIADIGAQALLLGNVQNAAAIVAAIDSVSAADVSAAAKKVAASKLSIGAIGNLAHVPYINQLN